MEKGLSEMTNTTIPTESEMIEAVRAAYSETGAPEPDDVQIGWLYNWVSGVAMRWGELRHGVRVRDANDLLPDDRLDFCRKAGTVLGYWYLKRMKRLPEDH